MTEVESGVERAYHTIAPVPNIGWGAKITTHLQVNIYNLQYLCSIILNNGIEMIDF